MDGFSNLDLIALAWFWLLWIGYTLLADSSRLRARSMSAVMNRHRQQWARNMLDRDNRMVDVNTIGNLLRSTTFFASTSIFAIGGLLAALGASDRGVSVISDVPYAATATRIVWETKILQLTLIFVYAFFKFGWSFRLFNYTSVLLGAAPLNGEQSQTPAAQEHAAQMGRIACLAAEHSNRGLRAYFFALAAIAWFFHPAAFMVATAWVVLVLYRREFRSRALRTVRDGQIE